MDGSLTSDQRMAVPGMPIDSLRVVDPGTKLFSIDDLRLEEVSLLKVTESRLVPAVLSGATATLRSGRPILFLAETSGISASVQCGLIRDLGYRCWRIESPLFNPTNFNQRADDIFLGRTGVAFVAIPQEGDVGIFAAGLIGMTAVTPL
jgi:hypothetical protein